MDFTSWFVSVLNLFSNTVTAVSGVPVFRFFLALLLFFAVVNLLAYLLRQLKKGGL